MKLLFDQNLSPRLVAQLADLFPESSHVRPLGLGRASDREVWEYARQHGFAITGKDVDPSELSPLLGFPPRYVWIRTGNCSTDVVERVLREHHEALLAFDADPNLGVLELR